MNEKFTRDLQVLREHVCWVVFRFQDGSVKALQTTLREDLLEGLPSKENCLYDLEKQKWFNLNRVKGSQIEIYLTVPELTEVDWFANKYLI